MESAQIPCLKKKNQSLIQGACQRQVLGGNTGQSGFSLLLSFRLWLISYILE